MFRTRKASRKGIRPLSGNNAAVPGRGCGANLSVAAFPGLSGPPKTVNTGKAQADGVTACAFLKGENYRLPGPAVPAWKKQMRQNTERACMEPARPAAGKAYRAMKPLMIQDRIMPMRATTPMPLPMSAAEGLEGSTG